MFNHIIAFSLRNRLVVLAATVLFAAYGLWLFGSGQLPVDVFPDLNRPTVTVMTEAPGLTPEQVEVLVSRPIESLLNGATGVQRVRSSSAVGLSIVWVEFDWGSDIFRDRQIVTEKLQLARERLPKEANPTLAPVTSIMGEIMLIGVRSTCEAKSDRERTDAAMEIRTLAEFKLRNRLLAVDGVAQVSVVGGILKQYQVVTSPGRLRAHDVTLEQLTQATEKANVLAGGGILERSTRESVLSITGRSLTLEDIGRTPVIWRDPRPVLISDVADIRFGGPIRRGAASIRTRDDATASDAVILTVQKQPHADTLALDRRIDETLNQLQGELPPDVKLERQIFRQADFIRSAIGNVEAAIRDGAIWVLLVLFVFLWNFRTSAVTLAALPLSLLVSVIVFHWFEVGINTMTLGGIAVAVGELVDDAIVDVENIYRRLKENRQNLQPEAASAVVLRASTEIRSSIVYSTLIVCVVVLPLFALGGLEGRMFAPLGLAYIVSLAASLLVSLTVTPVLASLLLPGASFLSKPHEPFLLRFLKWVDVRLVRAALCFPKAILLAVFLLVVFTAFCIAGMGGEFLPPFNEGTLTINAAAEPGTSLRESNRLGSRLEELLLEVAEVESVARRTGRAEMDEHAEGVNSSEIDVRLADSPRPRTEVLADIRDRVTRLPGVKVNIGQPISHRLDHVLSGTRAQIAVKVFGADLRTLRDTARDIQAAMSKVRGVVDLSIEPQVEISQVRLEVKRPEAAQYGLAPGDVARLLETAYKGRVVSEVIDEERHFDLVVWYDEESRSNLQVIGATVLDTPSGRKVALDQVARVLDTTGPNTLNHENIQRRIVVSCNVQGRDLAGVVADIRGKLEPIDESLRGLQGSYRIEYGGQFEAQQQANRRLLILGGLAIGVVLLLLYQCLGSWPSALLVLSINIPLAAFGAVVALLLTNRPRWETLSAVSWTHWPQIWLQASNLSVAHWVGFITLIGIVSRNGILMISHYHHLMRHEGEAFNEKMIVRGTLERLAPVLMTASVAIIGLVPLALGAGQTGKEILHPLAIVVIGGLLASTLLDQVVTPALYYLFGTKTG